MTTGRRIIINHDKSGWRTFLTRNWGERDYKSDRKKGQRKMLNQKIRTLLKREVCEIVKEELED